MRCGADPSYVADDGNAPLHKASAYGNTARLILLLVAGADMGSLNSGVDTPLHVAADKGCVEVLQLLLAAGAEPNRRNKHYDTPLGCAVTNGSPAAVALLLQYGANVHVTDVFGNSPIRVARDGRHWNRGHAMILDLLQAAAQTDGAGFSAV